MSARSCIEIADAVEATYDKWNRRQIDTGVTIAMLKASIGVWRHAPRSLAPEAELLAQQRIANIVNKFDAEWRARVHEECAAR